MLQSTHYKKNSGINFRYHHLPECDCLSKDQVVRLRFSNQHYGTGVVQILDLTIFFLLHVNKAANLDYQFNNALFHMQHMPK